MAINRQSLRTQVKQEIIASMHSGEIGPGERLVELRLAERYGVSQAPVREALRELEAVGLVISKPNRGTFAGDFAGQGMSEIFQVRGALEELATRLATPLLRDDVSALQSHVDAMAAAARIGDAKGVVEHSKAFHAKIIDAAGNRTLELMWRGLDIDTHTDLTVRQPQIELDSIAVSHQPIVDAIADGDIERACQAARVHQDDLEATSTSDPHKVSPAVTESAD